MRSAEPTPEANPTAPADDVVVDVDLSDAKTSKSQTGVSCAALFLIGALTSFPPLTMEIYIPSLPTIEEELHTSSAHVLSTISVYTISFGATQLVLGPLSDVYGRRGILLVAMATYTASSAACMFAPSVEVMYAPRIVQGAASAGAIILGQAILRDLLPVEKRESVTSKIAVVRALSPMLAPVLGSSIAALLGWRANFGLLVLLGLYAVVGTKQLLAESLPAERRQPRFSLRAVLGANAHLLSRRDFTCWAVPEALGFGGFFVWISCSSYILQALATLPPPPCAFLGGTPPPRPPHSGVPPSPSLATCQGMTDSCDLVPIGAYHGKGKRTGVYGAYLLACYNEVDEEYQSICKIGTGFSDEALKQHTEALDLHKIDAPRRYYNVPEGPSITPDVWFEPKQVIRPSPSLVPFLGVPTPPSRCLYPSSRAPSRSGRCSPPTSRSRPCTRPRVAWSTPPRASRCASRASCASATTRGPRTRPTRRRSRRCTTTRTSSRTRRVRRSTTTTTGERGGVLFRPVQRSDRAGARSCSKRQSRILRMMNIHTAWLEL